MLQKNGSKTAFALGALALASGAFAQISVRIDDRPLAFSGQGPAQVQGRVLVPLRGIMEALGATVKFDGATQAVTATRGASVLSLVLGNRNASVDGRLVTLDVPAQIVNGSTMVPLRFVGEALGVGVNWQGSTNTVLITSGGQPAINLPPTGGGTMPTTPGAPSITGFTTSAANGQWLRAGERLNVTLSGTAGGNASFTIPGVVDTVALKETRAGVYEGSFQVPTKGGVGLSGANVIGRLNVAGKEQLIQGANPIAFDPDAPTISAFSPAQADKLADRRPNISAAYADPSGSGIDRASVRLLVDGKDVTSAATRGEGLLVYTPREDLAIGAHTVELTVGDVAGNSAKKSWSFTVADVANLVKSFTFDGPDNPAAGDVVNFRLEAEPGAKVTFDIGTRIANRPMAETSPGVYTADYTVRRDEVFSREKVVAHITTANGQRYTTEAKTTLGTAVVAPPAPTISTPAEGKVSGQEITVTGTAARAASVEITVEYTTRLLGVLPTRGSISTTTVTPDANGKFTSEPISLKISLEGRGTEYTVTVVSISADGTRSESSSVRITR